MPRPPRKATAAPAHSEAKPSRPPLEAHRLELPEPPETLTPAGRAAWADLAPWAERELRPEHLGMYETYCSACGDLSAARAEWLALGAPMFLQRAVGPHQGLAEHPALHVLNRLGKQKLRLAGALGLLPRRPSPTAPTTSPADPDDLPLLPVGLDQAIGERFFND